MKDTKTTSTAAVGICDLLTVLFIALKLCKVISWSWVWVLSPFWIPPVIIAICVIILIIKSKIK